MQEGLFELKQQQLREKREAQREKRQLLGQDRREALEYLVAPVSSARFLAEYWEQGPLHVMRGEESYYEGLFSLPSLWESVLRRGELLGGERLMRSPEDLLLCRVTDDGSRVNLVLEGDQAQLTLQQVEAYLARGYTAQVYQPQRTHVPLARLMSALEDEFGSHWGANSYVTPAHSRGLAAHYDDVDVFILQTEGTKLWRIYEPTEALPSEYSADFTPEEVEHKLTLHMEVVLRRGDLLYLPRGWIHQAEAQEELSHHVTLSTFQNHNFRELLSAYFEAALDRAWRSDLTVRAGLPLDLHRFGTYAPSSSHFGALLDLMARNVVEEYGDAGGAVDLVRQKFMQTRMPPVNEISEERIMLEVQDAMQDEDDGEDLPMSVEEEEEGDEDPQEEEEEDGDHLARLAEDDCLVQLAVEPTSLMFYVVFDGQAGKPWDQEPMLVALHSQNNLVTRAMTPEGAMMNAESGNKVAFPMRYERAFRMLIAAGTSAFVVASDLPIEDVDERTSFLGQLEASGLIHWE